MAYTPTEWATGDVITATKLNNMEQGIEDAFVAPAVTIADEGDVLTVNSSGAWVAAAPASQLPAVTSSDAGDVLTVNSSGAWAAAAPASQLPEVTAADQGKVLTVDSSGDWDAASIPVDVYEMEGVITVNQQLVPQSFTLTSGDVAEIPLHKIVKMKSMVSVGGQTNVIEMNALLSAHNLGTVIGSESYHFTTILFLNSKIYYASVHYTVSNTTWGATMIELTRADI